MIDWLNAVGAGLVGALALALMTDVSRGVGLIGANLTRYQGCIVLGRSEGAGAWLAGMAMHLAMGSVLALGYAVLFGVVWGEASWTIGALIGLAILAALALMALVAGLIARSPLRRVLLAAGALTAVLIGLPAIRIQGLYLAVTTLAFGYAMENYVLNEATPIGRALLPEGFTATIVRPMLYGRWDLENDRSFYYVCVGALVLCMAAALAFRSNRSGRVVIAMRDNQRAAASYSMNPVRVRLAAFAISGGMAGLAGTLFAYSQHNVLGD
ncbi:MAG: branched-chain amino acid ABC transporter permease, partial [Gemmatimonadetes bacterium]|nr:branched-chain amino acid ABC transporter permease [Gemmatimonadota bacterium]